jgi:hypothetical protein
MLLLIVEIKLLCLKKKKRQGLLTGGKLGSMISATQLLGSALSGGYIDLRLMK